MNTSQADEGLFGQTNTLDTVILFAITENTLQKGEKALHQRRIILRTYSGAPSGITVSTRPLSNCFCGLPDPTVTA